MCRLTFILTILLFPIVANASIPGSSYTPRGVGGGGAMAAYSISPYADLRFVGTDMGTLYRSADGGKTWQPISQREVKFGSDLDKATDVGFGADGETVFFATEGRDPKRSRDQGLTWTAMDIPLRDSKDPERIKYWSSWNNKPGFVLCATTQGIYLSQDAGGSWARIDDVSGDSQGTWVDAKDGRIYHATESGIFVSQDSGASFGKWYSPEGVKLRAFAGGRDASGATLVFIDSDGKDACSWARWAGDTSDDQKRSTVDDCGYVWVDRDTSYPHFVNTKKEGGRYLRMASNDSKTVYVTGGNWARQYGSKVWISNDAGKSWKLKFQVYDWDRHPYQPWPSDRLEYSAVGLDVGWDDNLYTSFVVNPMNSAEAGGTGYYFLHTTKDRGEHWLAPFTHFADSGARDKGKRWSSTGLEVTSALKLKFNPKNSSVGYAAYCDLGGLVTEDGGKTWRISKAKYNTNYDYAFDPGHPELVFAASGNHHDFPLNFNQPTHGEGGIFESSDRGRHWKRLTPVSAEWNRQFLSVAFDPIHHVIYGGTQSAGIARSTDGGAHWELFNPGLPEDKENLVIPQLEVDPRTGTVYALLTGDAPDFTLASDTGIYRLDAGARAWKLLRGKVNRPSGVDADAKLWLFPSSFAVDFKSGALWLTDIENHGQWLATGAWESVDGGRIWNRQVQVTHPTAIVLGKDGLVSVSASNDLSGKWGKGGALFSKDGGATWSANRKLPFESILFSSTPDPKDPKNAYYLFFGGGMLYGPWPGPLSAEK